MKNFKQATCILALIVALGPVLAGCANNDGTTYSSDIVGKGLSGNRVQERYMTQIRSACPFDHANDSCVAVDHEACFVAVHDGGTAFMAEMLGGTAEGTIATVGGVVAGSAFAGFNSATTIANAKFDGPLGVFNGAWTGGDRAAQRELNAVLMCDTYKGQAGGYAPFDEGFVGSSTPKVNGFNPNGSGYRASAITESRAPDPELNGVGMTVEEKNAFNVCRLAYPSAQDTDRLRKLNECMLSQLAASGTSEAPAPRHHHRDRASSDQDQDGTQTKPHNWD